MYDEAVWQYYLLYCSCIVAENLEEWSQTRMPCDIIGHIGVVGTITVSFGVPLWPGFIFSKAFFFSVWQTLQWRPDVVYNNTGWIQAAFSSSSFMRRNILSLKRISVYGLFLRNYSSVLTSLTYRSAAKQSSATLQYSRKQNPTWDGGR